jgi:hypothetical protein
MVTLAARQAARPSLPNRMGRKRSFIDLKHFGIEVSRKDYRNPPVRNASEFCHNLFAEALRRQRFCQVFWLAVERPVQSVVIDEAVNAG